MIAILRSLWAWFVIALLTVLWLPLLAVVRLFDRDPAYYNTGRWFRRLGATMTRASLVWRVRVSGIQVENPRNPYIVVSNHQSHADIPVISRLPWDMKWVGKVELFKLPICGWLMQLASDIPVDRSSLRSRAKVLIEARKYLDKACSVMFFPEGTRSPDGRVYAFSDGPFRLAIKAQLPILPLAVDGTYDALPKHSWKFGDPATIQLKVLPPVETTGLKAGDTEALRKQIRGQIIEQIAAWREVPVTEVEGPVSEEENKDSAKTTPPPS